MQRQRLHITPIALDLSPARLLAEMPQDAPVAALVSGDPEAESGPAPSSARWSLIARPTRFATDLAALGEPAGGTPGAPTSDATPHEEHRRPPFTTGWLALLSFGLGRRLEPRASHVPRPGEPVRAAEQQPPEVWLARVDDALIYDHVASQWWGMSSEPEGWRELVPPGMRTLTAGSVASGVSGARGGLAASDARFTLDPLVPEVPRALFEAMVARVLAYIHAGDCYQVNLAHRLSAAFEGDARALFLSLLNAARPWYGSYFELAGDADPSASPPCFVHCGSSPEGFIEISAPAGDGTRTITTRPMKGTRRASDATSADLAAAAKDRAELAMIVDLMRNDLGRVAQLGSVRVTQPHTIERHGTGHTTLLQATATITASLAPSTSIADVLRATFPPGSVTGAPKIRAMQIIDELEHAERGPYCGCAGFLGDDGSARLSVNIRSALIERARKARADEAARGPAPDRSRLRANPARFPAGSRLSYWVGAGIVAESEPASEWDETLAKAGAIRAIAQAPSASSVGASQEP